VLFAVPPVFGKIDKFLDKAGLLFYICSDQPNGERSLSDPVEPIAPRYDRSPAARGVARQRRTERERRIVSLLNVGVSIGEIAARERVSLKRMRNLVREILAQRMPQPPADFVALQISRLNEALLVSYSAMGGANLRAVDRVVRIVRELDRYHGFSPRAFPADGEELRIAPPPGKPLALEARRADPLAAPDAAP
jgi:DNA-binding CsgD family transcriptional regulator